MVYFYNINTGFKVKDKKKLRKWIKDVVEEEDKKLKMITIVFCPDEYLLQMNNEYLNHDFYTDVLTFDISEKPEEIHGDIFISYDRIQENALKFKASFQEELKRIIVHGVLHLIGYNDKTKGEKRVMREKEDKYIARSF